MNRRYIKWIGLIGSAAIIKLFSLFPDKVEKIYSNGIYPLLSKVLRLAFGWIPFSVGDLFYAAAAIWIVVSFVRVLKRIYQKRINKPYIRYVGSQLLQFALIIYISFNLLWGLNYNRRGIMYQLQLKEEPYSTAELSTMVGLLVDKLNYLDSAARYQRPQLNSKTFLFRSSVDAYRSLAADRPIFFYRAPSVKPSIFSYLGNYLGFSGYYNPFSGEAQVNTTVPVFVLPYTTCHEIGHQLGYAKEDEANFAGFLAAKSSEDPSFRYSVYFDLYSYAALELYLRDSTLLIPIREKLHPSIRGDFKTLRTFFAKYQNPFEPVVRLLYGRYLRANEQPRGMMSYNAVTGRLIAYYRKFGREAL